jgi:hypothetical protein
MVDWLHGEQRFFILMSIIDVFDRAIVAYYIGLTANLDLSFRSRKKR